MCVKSVKNKPVIYGLTGGIASGKSTVTNYLINNGFLVFDSDEAVKKIWNDNKELRDTIFNNYKIDINSVIGKKELADLIYNNLDIKNSIESLIHPLVFKMIDDFINENNMVDIIIIDMPLLFEVNYEDKLFKTILVYVSKEVHLNRLMERDNISKEEALLKINSQMDLDDKLGLSNYIIKNNGSYSNLYEQVDILIERLRHEN